MVLLRLQGPLVAAARSSRVCEELHAVLLMRAIEDQAVLLQVEGLYCVLLLICHGICPI